MVDRKDVLVTGATGQQGGALTRFLLRRGHKVRAFTRRPTSAAALRDLGARVFAGDFNNAGSLAAAAAGADAMYLMSTPYEAGPGAEVRQACTAIDAAAAVGVGHLIYASIASADQNTGVGHIESKYRIEQYLRDSGLRHTIIRLTAFFEALIQPWTLPALRSGTFSQPLSADVPMAYVALADIATFAALVIEQPDRFAGRVIEIASDELTGAQFAETFTRHAGREITYVPTSLEEARAIGGNDMVAMFEFFARGGFKIDIRSLHRAFPEVNWHTADSWAAERNLKELLEL
jgi:uncharacterized protein YbjT (DUF2867 family)